MADCPVEGSGAVRRLTVGLTGGIGSGKSAAAACFEARGAAVVDADRCSRVVVEPGSGALEAIGRHFGDGALLPDGSLNRGWVREQVFASAKERQWLESLLHPLIDAEIRRQLSAAPVSSGAAAGYSLLMSPLLLETGQRELCERIVVVDVPEQVQIERAAARDGVSEEQVRRIMRAQMRADERLAQADFVLRNDRSLPELDAQVGLLHDRFAALACGEAGQA